MVAQGVKKTEFRVPTDPPKFTFAQLKAAIPAHCFVRSTTKSLLYTFLDILGVIFLYYLSTFIPIFPTQVQYLLWPAYWILQGGVMTGIWVVAHECGHRAYSDSILVCDIVGWVLHSFLLVPYHGWRISHGKHHISTGNMERDEVFVPLRSSTYFENQKPGKHIHYEPPSALFMIIETVVFFLIGWFVYLSTHASGRDYGKKTNHFLPSSPLFSPQDYWHIVVSNIGIVAMLSLIVASSVYISFSWMVFSYFVPYLIVNFWLLLYTYMHHTDVSLPHYPSDSWQWLMGALATVDRDYGFLWNTLHHNIGNTHVLHHLFSKIPHYHAIEASEAIKPILGDYYFESNEPILSALYKNMKSCKFVDDSPGNKVYWWSDRPVSATKSG